MLLSAGEAAQRLGIPYAIIKHCLYRGKLKAVKAPGGHYRLLEPELDSFLHRRNVLTHLSERCCAGSSGFNREQSRSNVDERNFAQLAKKGD